MFLCLFRASRRLVSLPSSGRARVGWRRRGGESSQQRQGTRRVEETGRPSGPPWSVGGDRENRVLGVGRGSGSRVVTIPKQSYRLTREQLSQLTLFPLLPQLCAPVFLKLLTGSEEWLDDRRTRGVAELCEETSRRGAIPAGARGGLGVNREIAGSASVF
ncbi:hypothetical protein Taro_045397 [Colocasia esculenta]|uniref:Uncharacterized protein n=1 Tax=Colocasia esculenta TaxID=4460 RepID=A0A843X6H6_COLES|nr:hypothetical protein [Colocasia esculenta]